MNTFTPYLFLEILILIVSFINDRFNAFRYAFQGLRSAIKGETHLVIHLNAAIIVIILGFNFNVSFNEWFMLLACITLVISLELINSAIELLCNMITTERHHKIKYIKDVSAAAVLVTVIFSVVIGLFIFVPKIFS